MKKLLLAALLVLLPTWAWANDCLCASGTCTQDSATNWTTCGGTFPQATDSIHVTGGTLNMDRAGASTYLSMLVDSGTVNATFTGSATWNFNTVISPSPCGTIEYALFVQNGSTFTVNGKDLVVNWTGTGAGIHFVWGYQLGCPDNGLDVNLTLRGVEREVDVVGTFSEGTIVGSANFVDCIDGAAGAAVTAMNVGDTMVFTSGHSKEYWYEVTCNPDACIGAGAPNACCNAADVSPGCGATDCNGGPCDYQITRNSTGSRPGSVASSNSWDSFVGAGGTVGGPLRKPTPDDNDGDNTNDTDSAATRPSAGDSFVVFKPILFQGATNPITNGILLQWLTSQANIRYVEISKTSGQQTENCSGGGGTGALWTYLNNSTAPEGDIAFVNLHNTANRQMSWEFNATKDSAGVRANRPITYRHFYVHDTDAQVDVTCPPAGADPTAGMNPGIVGTTDTATLSIDGITFEGIHAARLANGPGFALSTAQGSPSVQYKNIIVRDLLVHDIPKFADMGLTANGVTTASGANNIFEGVTIWDIGRAGLSGEGVSAGNKDSGVVGTPPTKSLFKNAYIVNIDANTVGEDTNSTSGFDAIVGTASTETSRHATITNSFLGGIVGSAGYGGRWLYNFIKDVVAEDDGVANPGCTAGPRAGVVNPVEFYGNVVLRASALSCMGMGTLYRGGTPQPYAVGDVWKNVSNYYAGMDSDAASDLSGVHVRVFGGNTYTIPIDVYNNFVDFRGATGCSGCDNALLLCGSGSLCANRQTAFYNIVMNASGGPGNATSLVLDVTGGGITDHGYNRIFNNNGTPVYNNGSPDLKASEIDSDIINVSVDNLCESPYLRSNLWGGPIGPTRFGIQNFAYFHPAVLPLLDPDVFRYRFDYETCSRVVPQASSVK